MNLTYAVDRLYDAGWLPDEENASARLARLPDGRQYPSADAVAREFSDAGLSFAVRHTPEFNCYRATWSPAGTVEMECDDHEGTVIGTSECEAAVYALAQLRAAQNTQSIESATVASLT